MQTNNAKYKHKVVGRDTVTSQVMAYATKHHCPESKRIALCQITYVAYIGLYYNRKWPPPPKKISTLKRTETTAQECSVLVAGLSEQVAPIWEKQVNYLTFNKIEITSWQNNLFYVKVYVLCGCTCGRYITLTKALLLTLKIKLCSMCSPSYAQNQLSQSVADLNNLHGWACAQR